MKRFIQIIAATSVCMVFMALSINTAQAQATIANASSCDITFEYKYGPTGGCNITGGGQLTVPAGTTVPNVTPAGTTIFVAAGFDAQGCGNWQIENTPPAICVTAATGFAPNSQTVPCPPCGGSYTVTLAGAFGIVAF